MLYLWDLFPKFFSFLFQKPILRIFYGICIWFFLWNLRDFLADLRDQIYGPFILELKICVDSPGSCFKGLQIRRLIDFHPGVFQFLQLPVLLGGDRLSVFLSVYSSPLFQRTCCISLGSFFQAVCEKTRFLDSYL